MNGIKPGLKKKAPGDANEYRRRAAAAAGGGSGGGGGGSGGSGGGGWAGRLIVVRKGVKRSRSKSR